MKLSQFINQPSRQQQLEIIEEAIGILSKQKAAFDRQRKYIKEWSGEVEKWEYAAEMAEMENGPLKPDGTIMTLLNEKKASLERSQLNALKQLAVHEFQLAQTLGELFEGEGSEKKLSTFFAAAAKREDEQTRRWKPAALEAYDVSPPGVALDTQLAAASITAKFVDAAFINRQIAQLNTLVDNGSLVTKAKRHVWQAMQRFA